MYGLLLKTAAQTLLTIGADEKRLGAKLGVTFVLHTWGSAMTHHPHVHGIVPGGGLSLDGKKWVSSKSGFFLPVRVLSRLFRRLYLEKLAEAYQQNQLIFFGESKSLEDEMSFTKWLTPLQSKPQTNHLIDNSKCSRFDVFDLQNEVGKAGRCHP